MRKIVFGTIMLIFLVPGMLTLAFEIKPVKSTWTGTVYIRANGSIDPSDAPIITYDNLTYTLTDNITSSADGIIIERNQIILEGAGYTVKGTGEYPYVGILIKVQPYNPHIFKVTIKNVRIENFWCGIYLEWAESCTIFGNSIASNIYGIYLSCSQRCTLSRNNIMSCTDNIFLEYSEYNVISENNITGASSGVILSSSSNNIITGNNIRDSYDGLDFLFSSNNIVSRNNLNNYYGVYLHSSNNNTFCHNNFSNVVQVVSFGSYNVWDNGYPSGGNYWSDYAGIDEKSGPNQDQPGSDEIGDTPYIINNDNKDRYPLMKPLGFPLIHDVAVVNIKPFKSVVCEGYSTNLNVTVVNYGDFPERFIVILYANNTGMLARELTVIDRASITLTFTWNTEGFAKGSYTIWAYAKPVPGETDLGDNTFIDGQVIVSMVGDVAGIGTFPDTLPDGKVDMKDVAVVSRQFGIHHPDPRYVPNYDINSDGKNEMKDVAIVSKQFGKTDP